MAKLMVRIEDDIAVLVRKSARANSRSVPKEVDRLLREAANGEDSWAVKAERMKTSPNFTKIFAERDRLLRPHFKKGARRK